MINSKQYKYKYTQCSVTFIEKMNTAVFLSFPLQIKSAFCRQLPVLLLYNTTQCTVTHIYSAFHQHPREPLNVSARSAFPQTNKPAAFFFFYLFMFSLCNGRLLIYSLLNIQMQCVFYKIPSITPLDTESRDTLLMPICSALAF